MRKGGTSCRPLCQCLSVCLFVTLVYCIQTAKDTRKLLYRPDSPIILVFMRPSGATQLYGEPRQLWLKYTGVGKKLRFLTEIAVYLGNRSR